MKIAQIAPIGERVPPKKYGGTERVIYELCEGLVRKGHDVTLFATGDSKTSAHLYSILPKSIREMNLKNPYGLNEWTMAHIGVAYAHAKDFDIIHDHTYALSIPTANLSPTPVVNTIHGCLHESNIPLFSLFSKINYVTISKSQAPQFSNINIADTIYNGLTMNHYPFIKTPKNYLLYIGRASAEKGVHFAIEAALRANIPLVLAAKVDASEQEYFDSQIKPYLSDGKITWLGEINEEERNTLMSNALAFLHPVTWPEPFGLTLIESMACGTPVIAFGNGSIPEVVEEGKSGFVVDTVDQMVDAISRIKSIDRSYCREYALSTFNAERMVDGYEAVYERILMNANQKKTIKKKSLSYYKNLYSMTSSLFETTLLNSVPLSLTKSK